MNDEHPFFIFYTENQEVNKKDIYIKVNNLQKDFINEQKLDVRNIIIQLLYKDIIILIKLKQISTINLILLVQLMLYLQEIVVQVKVPL